MLEDNIRNNFPVCKSDVFDKGRGVLVKRFLQNNYRVRIDNHHTDLAYLLVWRNCIDMFIRLCISSPVTWSTCASFSLLTNNSFLGEFLSFSTSLSGSFTFVVPLFRLSLSGVTVDRSSRLWRTGLSLWTHSELLKLSFKKMNFS